MYTHHFEKNLKYSEGFYMGLRDASNTLHQKKNFMYVCVCLYAYIVTFEFTKGVENSHVRKKCLWNKKKKKTRDEKVW